MRGKGFGITPTSLKKKTKTKSPSNKELHEKLEKLQQEVYELRKEKEIDQATGFKDTSDKASINGNFGPNIPKVIIFHLYKL